MRLIRSNYSTLFQGRTVWQSLWFYFSTASESSWVERSCLLPPQYVCSPSELTSKASQTHLALSSMLNHPDMSDVGARDYPPHSNLASAHMRAPPPHYANHLQRMTDPTLYPQFLPTMPHGMLHLCTQPPALQPCSHSCISASFPYSSFLSLHTWECSYSWLSLSRLQRPSKSCYFHTGGEDYYRVLSFLLQECQLSTPTCTERIPYYHLKTVDVL